MKTILLLGIILSCMQPAYSQKNSWDWAKTFKNSQNASIGRVTRDALGNIYGVGLFTNSVSVGDSLYITNGGSLSTFIFKMNVAGDLLWSKPLVGTGRIDINALALDKTGNVYIGGGFSKSFYLGDTTFTTATLPGLPLAKDMFICKFSTDGIFQWAKHFGTLQGDEILSLGVNSKQNIVVAGYFSDSTIHFDKIKLTSNHFYYYESNSYIAQFDSTGQIIWAKNSKGKSADAAYSLAIDKEDNNFIVGDFSNSIDFDGIKVSSISSGLITGDVYLAKYDSSGVPLWANSVGGYKPSGGTNGGSIFPSIVTIDSAGNPLIAGNYTDCSVIFDKTDYSSKLSGGDMWMAQYSNSGNFIWSKNMGGGHLYDIKTDHVGNIYLAGEYGNGAFFDTITLNNVPATSPGSNLFVAKYNTDGRVQWVETVGGNCAVLAASVAVSIPNEIVVSGQFYAGGSVVFGSHTCRNYGTDTISSGNGFIAMLIPNAVGVQPLSRSNFEVFPNPAQNKLHIRQSQSGSTSNYSIYNTIGECVASGQLKAVQEQELVLPDLPEGMYYLNIKSSTGSISQKISIHH